MTDRFVARLAQMDPTVGALRANADIARAVWKRAKAAGDHLVMLPEMALAGYQAQDLVLKRSFVAACRDEVEALARDCADGPAMLIGAPWARPKSEMQHSTTWDQAHDVFNAMVLIEGGEIRAVILKHELPNYGVFDEKRFFDDAPLSGPISVAGVRIGVPICEDAWFPTVCETLSESGAEILLVPNGSPYERRKFDDVRLPIIVQRVVETELPLAYLNLVGAQDDQVFDGGSFGLNPGGAMAYLAPFFEPDERQVVFERGGDGWRIVEGGGMASAPEPVEADYRAMVEGTRAYVLKNGFRSVLLGLSGGIDSALVAAVAADALGPQNVRCFMLPSRFTSDVSLEDAEGVATALGVQLDTLPIGSAVETTEATLAPFFEGYAPDITEENLQSRLRGLYLMAISNKTGALLLTTGNKSEVAVGYATLYGDMCGAYNPLKDLYKTRVFETSRWRNENHRTWMQAPAGQVIPERIITKPPTAELREDQKDEDSLPPYEVLDAILEGLIEREESVDVIVAQGFERETVARVERLLYISEYKRNQAAPGPKLTRKAFFLDRRYPMTNRFRSG